jgi:hypothetical protein
VRHAIAVLGADEWFAGELDNGDQGMFPANFVDVIEPLPVDESQAAPADPRDGMDMNMT